MNEKELREKQNAEIRRREGLEDATCTDPACNGFKCNKRYQLMAHMGNMIVANLADDEEREAVPEVFYGSSALGLANCRCQKKA